MNMHKVLFLVFSILMGLTQVSAQSKIGIGASAVYNVEQQAMGAGLRVSIPYKENFCAVPHLTYYFTNNKLEGGFSVLYYFWSYRKFHFYALASGVFHGSYEGNTSVSDTSAAASGKASIQASGEAGFGVLIGNGCVRPFIEPRYSVNEDNYIARLGLMFYLGCKGGRKKGKGGGSQAFGRNKKAPFCPAYGTF